MKSEFERFNTLDKFLKVSLISSQKSFGFMPFDSAAR